MYIHEGHKVLYIDMCLTHLLIVPHCSRRVPFCRGLTTPYCSDETAVQKLFSCTPPVRDDLMLLCCFHTL